MYYVIVHDLSCYMYNMHQLMSVLNSLSFSASHSSTYLPDFVLHGTSESMHSFQPKLEKHLASMVKVYTWDSIQYYGFNQISCTQFFSPSLCLPPGSPPLSVFPLSLPPSPFLFPLPFFSLSPSHSPPLPPSPLPSSYLSALYRR